MHNYWSIGLSTHNPQTHPNESWEVAVKTLCPRNPYNCEVKLSQLLAKCLRSVCPCCAKQFRWRLWRWNDDMSNSVVHGTKQKTRRSPPTTWQDKHRLRKWSVHLVTRSDWLEESFLTCLLAVLLMAGWFHSSRNRLTGHLFVVTGEYCDMSGIWPVKPDPVIVKGSVLEILPNPKELCTGRPAQNRVIVTHVIQTWKL